MRTKDQDFIECCYLVAQHSHDPRTQNGAMLLTAGNSLYSGLNGVPDKIQVMHHMLEAPEKYLWMEHAERDVILRAINARLDIVGSTLYCPWAACADCARVIALSGIKTLVRHKQAMERSWKSKTFKKWHRSHIVGDIIMQAYGVEVVELDFIPDSKENLTIMFHGQEWNPQNA